jgi:hypothetical protein
MSNLIEAALKDAADQLTIIGEEAAQEVQDTLKSIGRSITNLGSMLIKGEIDREEAEMSIKNLIRAAESTSLASLIDKERRLIRRGVSIATNLLTSLAAGA